MFQMLRCNLCWHVRTMRWEKHNNQCESPECDRQTDRQTDGEGER